ncbi:MAG: cytoplasmic iron level regulating protein YaaA (DUF328/UPF0246 family) [Paraglaciecola sp.]
MKVRNSGFSKTLETLFCFQKINTFALNLQIDKNKKYMIALLSPAKTLDFNPTEFEKYTNPRLLTDSSKLVKLLKEKSAEDVKKLMHVSDKIAELNVQRFHEFETPFNRDNAKQSLLAFKGDVYTGLAVDDFSEADLDFAQKHLRILSGLYGLLKPLDLMQAYRLEMGTRLENGGNKNLYEFWGDKITKLINDDVAESGGQAIINLASNEYFKSVNPEKLKGDLYKIDFKEDRDGKLKVIAFNAKKARGIMSREIIKNRITNPEDLKGLNIMGYIFNDELSTERSFLFAK